MIAVIYESNSGLGDIGKHVILQALKKNIRVKAICVGGYNQQDLLVM